ncbi:hypothetical protein NDU88_006989 [Pleurodeles waltl]|uniref:Uncharacterized protein n=1 Tax=Pleurodeles waltl TaxID=8319 RepID=A0AAV7LQR6_PLEWA|nr:hypothetical protein NDU88_006989 [Pleurodeles waltl]
MCRLGRTTAQNAKGAPKNRLQRFQRLEMRMPAGQHGRGQQAPQGAGTPKKLKVAPSCGDSVPSREPTARPSHRPGPAGATARHSSKEDQGAAMGPRPPSTKRMQPKRRETTYSKRRGETPPTPEKISGLNQPPEGPRVPGNTASAAVVRRILSMPQHPEHGGKANTARGSHPRGSNSGGS